MENYGKIDEYYVKLLKFEQEARENSELEDLFELERRNYKPPVSYTHLTLPTIYSV